MTAKPVVPRKLTNRDVEDAITYCLSEDAAQATAGFVDALEQAYARISRNPGAGSEPYAHELSLPGLRFWPLARYPYLVFYIERPEHIDVWRVLHGQRDIPTWMQEPESV